MDENEVFESEGVTPEGTDIVGEVSEVVGPMKRRQFIRVAAAAAAATTAAASGAIAQVAAPAGAPAGAPAAAPGRGGGGGGGGGGAQQGPPPIPLTNGEPPALTFMPYPGGTGALMDKLIRERGAKAFDKTPITVPAYTGPTPTKEADLAFLNAWQIGSLIKDRKISSIDITNIYLERMKRYNGQLLAAVTILEGRGREEAQQADMDLRNGNWRGPLHGVPWGVKDLFAAKGTPTTWGAKRWENQIFDYDSDIVAKLRSAGAVLIAKLATGEYAQGDQWFRGRSLNPWNGGGASGSSAGPGTGTAAGLVGFSIGTETQGSITSPSTANGLSALRPTFGRISRYGGMTLSYSYDKAGPMCRSILDCALVFNALHGSSENDPSTVTMPFEFKFLNNLNGIRVGTTGNPPEVLLNWLRAQGATINPLPALPNPGTNSISVEGAAAMDYWVTNARASGEDPGNRFGVQGRTETAVDYLQSQRRRMVAIGQWAELLKDFDIMLGGLGASHATGHPVAVVPIGFGPSPQGGGGGGGAGRAGAAGAAGGAGGGAPAAPAAPPAPRPDMPLVTQVFGNLYKDDVLLSVLHAFQTAHDFHTHRPPNFLGS